MRRRDYYWSLYHTTEQNQIDNLRTDQVEAIYAAIPESMRDEWWIWRDGFESWKPFEDFPQLLVNLRQADSHVVMTPTPPRAAAPRRTVPAAPPAKESKKEKTQSGARVEKSKKPQSRDEDGFTKSGTKMVPSPSSATKAKSIGPARFELEDDDDKPLELTLMRAGKGEDRSNFRFDRNLEVRVLVGEKAYANSTVNVSLKGMQLAAALPKNLPRYFNVEIRQGNKVIPVVCSEVKNSDGSPSNRVKIEVNDYSPALLALLLAG